MDYKTWSKRNAKKREQLFESIQDQMREINEDHSHSFEQMEQYLFNIIESYDYRIYLKNHDFTQIKFIADVTEILQGSQELRDMIINLSM